MTTTQPTLSPRTVRAPQTVLIGDTDPEARGVIERALSPLGPQKVVHARDGDELERLFFESGPHDLVVCRSLLGARSGLQILAKARSKGRRASFIIYTSLDGPWLRVFVSDSEAMVLSSRVVSLEGFSQLAEGILRSKRR